MTSKARVYTAIFFVLKISNAYCDVFSNDYYVPIPDVTVTIGGVPSVPVQYDDITVPIVFDSPAPSPYVETYQAPVYDYSYYRPRPPPIILLDNGGSSNDNSLLYLLLLLRKKNSCGCNQRRGSNQCCRSNCCSSGPCYPSTYSYQSSYSSPCNVASSAPVCGSGYCGDGDYYSTRICDGDYGPVLSISFSQYD